MTAGRTLVLCLDTLGDLTLRQPLLAGLLDAGHEVMLVVRSAYAPLVPFIDPRLSLLQTDLDPYRLTDDTRPALERLRAQVVAERPDLVVFPAYTRSFSEDWLLRGAGGLRTAAFESTLPRPARIALATLLSEAEVEGPARATVSVSVLEDAHESVKNEALGQAILGHALPDREPVLTLPESARAEAATLLSALGLTAGRYAFGCPAGTANNGLKGWPIKNYIEQVLHLHRRHGLPVLLAGLPQEAEHLQAIARGAAAHDVPTTVHVGDPDRLPLLLGLVAHSRLYLGTDTGPMHFAGALGVPVVAAFGGGHWPRFLPRARRSFVATQELPCFGCGWECWLLDPVCITTIEARAVHEGIDWILGDGPDEQRVHRGRALDPVADHLVRSALAVRREHERAWRDALSRVEHDARERLAAMEELGRRLRDADEARRSDVEELTLYIRQLEDDIRRLGTDSVTMNGAVLEMRDAIARQRDAIARQQEVLDRRSVKLVRLLRLP